MDFETIEQFIKLNRSNKFNFLLTVFSTLISGFLIIFVANPDYCKQISAFLIILLSLTAIAPIYIFNQFCSGILMSQIAKDGLRKLASFADLPGNQDGATDEFVNNITTQLTKETIYNPPARQVAEITTIITTYVSAFLVWAFSASLTIFYLLLVVLSILVFAGINKVASKIISNITPENFGPIIERIKNDKTLKDYLAKRLDRIEKIIGEKRREE